MVSQSEPGKALKTKLNQIQMACFYPGGFCQQNLYIYMIYLQYFYIVVFFNITYILETHIYIYIYIYFLHMHGIFL